MDLERAHPIDLRYHRLARFHRVGEAGVRALNRAHVVILGCGALGAQHAETLARAGVGKLTLIDRDFVEITNLQRQTLFTEEDAKNQVPKVIAVKNHLLAINSTVKVTPHIADVSGDNIEGLIQGADLLLDGTDNLMLRMLINDACYKLNIPWIFGSALESYGMSYNFNLPHRKEAPCLRCLLDTIELASQDSCSSVGVIQPILQMISSLQTTEALKYFIEPEAMRQTLVTANIWDFHLQNINLNRLKDPHCLTCGSHPSYPALQEKRREAQRLCGDGSVMIREAAPLDLLRLSKRLRDQQIPHRLTEYFLNVDLSSLKQSEMDAERIMIFNDGRAIVYGLSEIEGALKVYERFLSSFGG